MTTSNIKNSRSSSGFRHEAVLYAGEADFVRRMAAFIRDSLASEEPVLVVLIPEKIDLLRQALDDNARTVRFADMAEIGRNPARIIPLWRDFVDGRSSSAKRVRGIGEPIWVGRTDDEIAESQRHESLINLAFDDAPAWILCPYDTEGLDAWVIDEALRSHPIVAINGSERASPVYRGLDAIAQPFDAPLPEPTERPVVRMVEAGTLESLRRFIAELAQEFGLSRPRAADLVLAVNEVATNTLRHAGGRGILQAWQEADTLVVEITDEGHIGDPMVGRVAPGPQQQNGLGLWIANQTCDLVQLRSDETGSVVRLQISRR